MKKVNRYAWVVIIAAALFLLSYIPQWLYDLTDSTKGMEYALCGLIALWVAGALIVRVGYHRRDDYDDTYDLWETWHMVWEKWFIIIGTVLVLMVVAKPAFSLVFHIISSFIITFKSVFMWVRLACVIVFIFAIGACHGASAEIKRRRRRRKTVPAPENGQENNPENPETPVTEVNENVVDEAAEVNEEDFVLLDPNPGQQEEQNTPLQADAQSQDDSPSLTGIIFGIDADEVYPHENP